MRFAWLWGKVMRVGQLIESVGSQQPIIVKGLENVPATFSSTVRALVKHSNELEEYTNQNTNGRIVLQFGGDLPSKDNMVVVTSRFYNKAAQSQMLQGVVNTVRTFRSSTEAKHGNGNFIAKRLVGHRQQGQLINQEPDNAGDYVFQPLVTIKSEYRVVVYFMNGSYHVAGVYRKTGSNMSFQSITGSAAYTIGEIAIAATDALGYGFSGVDVAIVEQSDAANVHINESVLGGVASLVGKVAGKLSDTDDQLQSHIPVVLEVNRLPSMANPMIAFDLIKSIRKNAT